MKSNTSVYLNRGNIIVSLDPDFTPTLTITDADLSIRIHGITVEAMKKAGELMARVDQEITFEKNRDAERKQRKATA